MKKTCKSIVTTLLAINEKGLKTRADLMLDRQLYNSLWFAVEDYVQNWILRSKTSGKNEEGSAKPGNLYKVETLEKYGVSEEDICHFALIRVMEKLDKVLQQDIAAQPYYIYEMINNLLYDLLRSQTPPKEWHMISLQDIIDSSNDDSCPYEHLIGDDTHNAERMLIEQETISELTALLKKKQALQLAAKQENILKAVEVLTKRPKELLSYIACVFLNMKPRFLAQELVERGFNETFVRIIKRLVKTYKIEPDTLRNALLKNKLNTHSLTVAADKKEVSVEISKNKFRATKRLIKK